MPEVTDGEFVRGASEIASGRGGQGEPTSDDWRAELVRLHDLLLSAPVTVADWLARRDEDELQALTLARVRDLTSGDHSWGPDGPRAGVREWAWAAWVEARAIDELVWSLHRRRRALWQGDDFRVSGVAGHLVPRPHAARRRAAARHQALPRRALLHHAVLPSHSGGLPVVVHAMSAARTKAERTASNVRFGAALFANGRLAPARKARDGSSPLTRYEAFAAEGFAESLSRQASRAVGECFVAVWPELTLAPVHSTALRHELRDANERNKGEGEMELAVLGSFHVDRDGECWNLGLLCDRHGEVVGEFRKLKPFVKDDEAGGGVEEDIVPGREILVVATEDFLFGIAICKDFCDLRTANPFVGMPLDFVLVP